MIEKKIFVDSDSVTLAMTPIIVLGINGKSQNPDRHAICLTASKARELAKLLNAAADLS